MITEEERKPGEREFVDFFGKTRFPFATIKKSVALVNKLIFFFAIGLNNSCLDVHLPAAPVACEWVADVTCVCHLADELWHWAVDLHCLAEDSLCSECLVGSHYKKVDQNRRR